MKRAAHQPRRKYPEAPIHWSQIPLTHRPFCGDWLISALMPYQQNLVSGAAGRSASELNGPRIKRRLSRYTPTQTRLQGFTYRYHFGATRFTPRESYIRSVVTGLQSSATRLQSGAIGLQSIATRLQSIATRLQSSTTRLQRVAIRLCASVVQFCVIQVMRWSGPALNELVARGDRPMERFAAKMVAPFRQLWYK